MSQPASPTSLPADQVIDALTAIHAEVNARLAAELAQLRVVVKLRDEEIAYLKSLQPEPVLD